MTNGEPTDQLSPRELIRRVVLICSSFMRNVAFYRAGHLEEFKPLLSERNPKDANFWRQVNGNFIDIAVLDWCKLFGNKKSTPRHNLAKHHWRRVVSAPGVFEAELLAHLQMDEARLEALIAKMRSYRDQFIAHLDNKRVMHIPELDPAYAAVVFYHWYIVEREARPGDLAGLPGVFELERGYSECCDDATQIYTACVGAAGKVV
jgi:hypothetical protein